MDLQMTVEKQLRPRHIKTLLEGVAIATGGLSQFCSEPTVVIVCSVFRAWTLVDTVAGTELDWLNTSFCLDQSVNPASDGDEDRCSLRRRLVNPARGRTRFV